MSKVQSQDKQKRTVIKYVASLAFMLLILFWTMKGILKDTSLDAIRKSILTADPRWIAAGFVLMLIYLLSWAEFFRVLIIKLFGYKPLYIACLNTANIGYYFNNITPSSSGGQPMQLLYLHRCGVDVGGASMFFIADTMFNNLVMILYATSMLIWQWDLMKANLFGMKYMLIVGYVFNGGLLLLMLGASIFPRHIHKYSRLIFNWLSKKKVFRHPAKVRNKLDDFFNSYGAAARGLTKQPALMCRLFFIRLIQFAAYNLVPYTACRALGASQDIIWPTFSLQSVLFLASSGFPTPGAVGITEKGFVTMFRNVLPDGQVESAMILARFINFYAFLVICAIVTVFAFAFAGKVKAAMFPDTQSNTVAIEEPKQLKE